MGGVESAFDDRGRGGGGHAVSEEPGDCGGEGGHAHEDDEGGVEVGEVVELVVVGWVVSGEYGEGVTDSSVGDGDSYGLWDSYC